MRTTTFAGLHSTFASILASQCALHSALIFGGVTSPVHLGPFISTEQEPVQVPLQCAFALSSHLPAHLPLHCPFPWLSQCPSHVPLHAPFESLPSHLPTHWPPQLPLKLASQLPSHVPSPAPAEARS